MSFFIDTVNRVLRTNGLLADDDDDIAAFTNTQHKGTIQLAKIAIQSSITELTADRLLPAEEADGTITYVADQRIYNLATDYVRMIDENPFFLEIDGSGVSQNQTVNAYPGGESQLRRQILDYRTQSGKPRWFYFPKNTTKQVAFYQVPRSDEAGIQLRYTYEKSVYPIAEGDTMPFSNDQEHDAFSDMSARYFQFLLTKQPTDGLLTDIVYQRSKASLMNLLKPSYATQQYGYDYT